MKFLFTDARKCHLKLCRGIPLVIRLSNFMVMGVYIFFLFFILFEYRVWMALTFQDVIVILCGFAHFLDVSMCVSLSLTHQFIEASQSHGAFKALAHLQKKFTSLPQPCSLQCRLLLKDSENVFFFHRAAFANKLCNCTHYKQRALQMVECIEHK